MIPAAELIEKLKVPIEALSVDSRCIDEATAFLAYPGEVGDGRYHINEAIAAGAAGIFWEAENFHWQRQWQVPNVAVNDLKAQSGYLADAVYGRPSRELPLVAVTGTNGKTTVSFFIAQLLAGVGINSGIIGTLGAGSPGQCTALKNTTPDAVSIHRWLRHFINEGMEAAVLEASSHGIVQGRLNGLHLSVAVLTNIAQDHLDYHGTMENYRRAKAALFDFPLEAAVINADDDYGRQLLKRERDFPVFTYGVRGDTVRWLKTEVCAGGLNIWIDGVWGQQTVALPFAGQHNVYNFLAAATAVHALQKDAAAALAAAGRLRLPPGRMQKICTAPAVYVDYAHTPAAIQAVLAAARDLSKEGRLLVLLGAGGERDLSKRAAMGKVASAGADVVVVTDDNPRNEDAAAIRTQLCQHAEKALNVADREKAIAAILHEARAQDTVLILGKGHETTQEINGEKLPFSDIETVRRLTEKQP